jgi:endonuclease/exonuclease/phosphatase (EEP) superfamily protein YafD
MKEDLLRRVHDASRRAAMSDTTLPEEPRKTWAWRRVFGMSPWFAIALVAAAGSATLAAFGGRLGWLWELTTHFRVQYFWALTLAAAALAVSRWRITAFVAAALAAVNLALILPLYFGPGPRSDGPTARALSLNIHFLNRDHLPTVELVGAEEPDLLLIVELTPEWVEALHPIELEYPYSELLPERDSSGIGLYSRRPFDEVTVKRMPTGLPVIVARLTLAGGPMTFIGVHTASPVRRNYFHYRNLELAEIAELAAAQRGPVVVMGDLNTTGWSPYFSDLLATSGLRDSRRGFGVQPTWPAVPMPLRIPIDHCLVSGEVGIVNRRVGAAVGSDHRPIIVDFTVDRK